MSRKGLHIFVLASALAGHAWVALNAAAGPAQAGAADPVPTPCLIRQATGFPCPSCGTTRSIEAVAAGDFAGAAGINPFGILLALAMVAFPAWVLHDLIRGRNGFHRFYAAVERTLRERRPVAVAAVALVLANWGWNILKGL